MTLTITLPDAVIDWVGKQTEAGNHAGPESYIETLIRRDWFVGQSLERIQRRAETQSEGEMTELDVREIIDTARMIHLMRQPGNDG